MLYGTSLNYLQNQISYYPATAPAHILIILELMMICYFIKEYLDSIVKNLNQSFHVPLLLYGILYSFPSVKLKACPALKGN